MEYSCAVPSTSGCYNGWIVYAHKWFLLLNPHPHGNQSIESMVGLSMLVLRDSITLHGTTGGISQSKEFYYSLLRAWTCMYSLPLLPSSKKKKRRGVNESFLYIHTGPCLKALYFMVIQEIKAVNMNTSELKVFVLNLSGTLSPMTCLHYITVPSQPKHLGLFIQSRLFPANFTVYLSQGLTSPWTLVLFLFVQSLPVHTPLHCSEFCKIIATRIQCNTCS